MLFQACFLSCIVEKKVHQSIINIRQEHYGKIKIRTEESQNRIRINNFISNPSTKTLFIKEMTHNSLMKVYKDKKDHI